MFTLLIALISSMCTFSPYVQQVNNKVGDLAADQLLPGTPVSYMKWGDNYYYYDVNGCNVYKNTFNALKCINRSSRYYKGEKCTILEYEYYEEKIPGDTYLILDYARVYDSKVRLYTHCTGSICYDYKYNDKNLVIERIITEQDDPEPTFTEKYVYKYDSNGHCISEAYYLIPIENNNASRPKPESVIYYTILKVDKYGNWISRKSSKGKIEVRTIVYR